MLIEVLDESRKTSFIVRVDRAVEELSKSLPFTTVLNVWKDEVYFAAPIKLELTSKIYKVELGKVYYWPPGSAICIFYGVSEPYTPVTYLGEFVGPLTSLRAVEDGDEGKVAVHELDRSLSEVTNMLKGLGYEVGTPLADGIRVIAASKYVGGLRVGFTLYVEPYGYYLESEELYKHGDDYVHAALAHRIKDVLSDCRFLRFDVDEEGYAVLTIGVSDLQELEEGLRELELKYPQVIDVIRSLPMY
ncbi:MAG: hypothetical protein J7L12_03745 [Desulfurococcales archaeon]|nr:hypothetical protein [Desulfurococcales archaeon]